jgi:hypothetical protein
MSADKKKKIELIQSLETEEDDSYTTYIKVTIYLTEK